MIYKIRIDKDNNKVLDLCEWDNIAFESNRTLRIQSNNLGDVQKLLENIVCLEVLQNDTVIATYTVYNTYANISYAHNIYIESLRGNYDCITVELSRINYIEELASIQSQLNKVVDIESMDVDEYRDYILSTVANDCEQEIYEGCEVGGHMFTYKVEDQQNLKTLFDTVIMSDQIAGLPYHASGENCRFFTRDEIITIYTTLLMRLIKITTYCNALNMMVQEMTTKEEIERVYYGMELSEEKQAIYDEIISQTGDVFTAILSNYITSDEAEE